MKRIYLITACLLLIPYFGSAQILRVGGVLHECLINVDQFETSQLGSRLYLDVSADLEIIHKIWYAYSLLNIFAPGFEYGTESPVALDIGTFFYPIRRWPIYVALGLAVESEGVKGTVGLGAFFPLSDRLSLRTKFNAIGYTSIGVGVTYSVFNDYDIPARPTLPGEDQFLGDVDVTATPVVSYVRKGRDCDVSLILGNTQLDTIRDVLVDVILYSHDDAIIETRPIIASEAIRPHTKRYSEEYPVFGLQGISKYIDVRSYGSFDKVPDTSLTSIGLVEVDSTQIQLKIKDPDIIIGKNGMFRAEINNISANSYDVIILAADILDEANRTITRRYVSVNEMIAPSTTTKCSQYTIYGIPINAKYLRFRPIYAHISPWR